MEQARIIQIPDSRTTRDGEGAGYGYDDGSTRRKSIRLHGW